MTRRAFSSMQQAGTKRDADTRGLCASYPRCQHCSKAKAQRRVRLLLPDGRASCYGFRQQQQRDEEPCAALLAELARSKMETGDKTDEEFCDGILEIDYAALTMKEPFCDDDSQAVEALSRYCTVPACIFWFMSTLAVLALGRLVLRVTGRKCFPWCCITGACARPFTLRDLWLVPNDEEHARHVWTSHADEFRARLPVFASPACSRWPAVESQWVG